LRHVHAKLRNLGLLISQSMREHKFSNSLSPPQQLFLKWFCVVLLFLVISILLIDSIRDSYSDKSTAYSVAQDFVSEHLVRPSSAQFPPKSTSGVMVKYLGKNRYLVSGYLDSLNTFGSSQRSCYTCIIRYIGAGEWVDEKISFE
jgi:hypothetical protein